MKTIDRKAVRTGLAVGGAVILLGMAPELQGQAPTTASADSATFYGVTPQSLFAGGVVIPAGSAVLWTSGTVPPLFNERAPVGTRERYGDTKIQATGVLQRIQDQLAGQGLSMRDVVYVRAYLVPDPQTGTIDTQGWNEAFAAFFGTENNPVKPGRSTVGVVELTNPDWLVELEAFAVVPR